MTVLDRNGPADSVRIAIHRADDGRLLDSAVNKGHAYIRRGVYPVFTRTHWNRFEARDTILDIRVVAHRGKDSGDGVIRIHTTSISKFSGPDTLFIR